MNRLHNPALVLFAMVFPQMPSFKAGSSNATLPSNLPL